MNPPTKPDETSGSWLFLIGLLLGGALLVYMAWDSLGFSRRSHSAHVIELTAANWQKEVVESPIPVVVDFWAPWCGPCRTLSPTIDKLADRFEGKVKVGKLNVDDAKEIAAAFGVKSIPRVLIFKGGRRPVQSFVGVESEARLAGAIEQVLASQ